MKADTITKDYISDREIFSDVFNYYIYGGRQVITPEQLEERDPTEIALPYGADGAAVPVQKFRDAQKLCAVMTDGKLEYVICGAEAQAGIHNAMAVRNNLYDALEYAGQVSEAAKSHRKAMQKERAQKQESGEENTGQESTEEGKKTPDSHEFLSGFWNEDRLIPSVTVTIYFGADEWTGPRSLLEMMEVDDPKVKACLNDYKLHVIAPAQMPDEEIGKLQSSLREVLLFIKYSKNKEELDRILRENKERFKEVERRAVDVIEVITNTQLKYEEREGKVDMCQAIREMRIDAEREGELRGEQKGELKKAQEAARNFYNLGIEVEKIAQGLGYAVETVKGWVGLRPERN